MKKMIAIKIDVYDAMAIRFVVREKLQQVERALPIMLENARHEEHRREIEQTTRTYLGQLRRALAAAEKALIAHYGVSALP